MSSNNVKKSILVTIGIVFVIAIVVIFIWFINTQPINWENVYDGLTISGIGLAGVFSVLIIFYLSTKLMMLLSNKFSKPDDAN